LAVYQNGVRINEAFGDTVNWDFIPERAIRRLDLFPSNPIFGLNAIGGAISLEMKNGFNYNGREIEGSSARLGGAPSARSSARRKTMSRSTRGGRAQRQWLAPALSLRAAPHLHGCRCARR